MTHKSVLVRYEGEIADANEAVGGMLAPYRENAEVPKYDWFQIGGRWQGMLKLEGLGFFSG